MTHSRVEDNHVEINSAIPIPNKQATQKIRNIQKLKRKKEKKRVHLEEVESTQCPCMTSF